MQVITDLQHFSSKNDSIVTIGNFDGVHLGHQALFEKLNQLAKEQSLDPIVVTFDPQPLEYFGREVPARLSRFEEKCELFRKFGVETVVCISFDESWASLEAQSFIDEFLKQQLRCRSMVIGHDFKFGHKRQGDVELLKNNQIGIYEMSPVELEGQRVSSSLVRAALKEGDFTKANKLLNHIYVMSGEVIHGDKRGREWGFPTANIALGRKVSPLHGIYTVKVHGLKEGELNAVASLGTRPVVDGETWLLEVFILDFDREIYGEVLQVEFCKKLRDELNFSSIDELKQQIHQDVLQAKEYFDDERLQANA